MENGIAPVTRNELQEELGKLMSQVEGRMDAQEERILARVGRSFTTPKPAFCKLFYGFAEATNKRFN